MFGNKIETFFISFKKKNIFFFSFKKKNTFFFFVKKKNTFFSPSKRKIRTQAKMYPARQPLVARRQKKKSKDLLLWQTQKLHAKKNDTFKLAVGILVNWHVGIWTRTASNKYTIRSIEEDTKDWSERVADWFKIWAVKIEALWR